MFVSPGVDAAIFGVLGLLIGSFLNVVVYRMPKMMGREWWEDSPLMSEDDAYREVFGKPQPREVTEAGKAVRQALAALPAFTLARPRSRCPHCGHQIRWYENIPIASWLALRGKCSHCKAPISPRYPIVEAVTGAFFALCAARWGLGPQAAAWAAFAALLICLFLIDMDTFLLPDDLNYLLLWLGLLASVAGWTATTPRMAILGAVVGYMFLWLVYHAFKLLTGKEGMGYGDFKLLGALGAWFGANYLLAIILVSSLVGAVIGVILLLVGRLANKEVPMPFGPYLAGAGLVCLALGPSVVPALAPFAFPFG